MNGFTRSRYRFKLHGNRDHPWVVELFAGLKVGERDQLNELLGRLRLHLARSLHGAGHEVGATAR